MRHQTEIDNLRRQLPRTGDQTFREYLTERLAVVQQSHDALTTIACALRTEDSQGVDSGMWSLDRATRALLDFDDEWVVEEEPAA
jgi:hypothetical protein